MSSEFSEELTYMIADPRVQSSDPLGFEVLLGRSRGTGTMLDPTREMHRKDHTSKGEMQ